MILQMIGHPAVFQMMATFILEEIRIQINTHLIKVDLYGSKVLSLWGGGARSGFIFPVGHDSCNEE